VRRRLARIAPIAFVLLAVAGALWAVGKNGKVVSDSLGRLGLIPVGIAIISGVLAVYMTCEMWRCILKGLGAPALRGEAARVFFVSQLGKYLPGSVWPVLAQMEYGRRTGAGKKTMIAANGLTVALSLAAGLIVAAVTLPFASADAIHQYWWTFAFLPFLLALLHPRAIPGLLNMVFRRLGRETMPSELTWSTIMRATGWALLSWLLFGVHLYVLVDGVGIHGWHVAAECVGGFALAVCAGVLFVPAPAGAGIRDAVLIASLSPSLGSGTALAVGLVSRVLLIVVDLLMAACFGLLARPGQAITAARPGPSNSAR
jgi:hypothetical protein